MLEENLQRHDLGSRFVTLQPACDPFDALRKLLLGATPGPRQLPAFADLVAGVSALASGRRNRVILPLGAEPIEYALLRRGPRLLIDCYSTEGSPTVYLRERAIALRELLDACTVAGRAMAELESGEVNGAALHKLCDRLRATQLASDPHAEVASVACSGGSLTDPGPQIPLAFGFEAMIRPSVDQATASHAFDDVHALLFEGRLWTFCGGSQRTIFEGPIVLAAQRMVAAVRALIDAWQADRNVHVRLRSGSFSIAVRRSRGEPVRLTLNSGREQSLTWPLLDVDQAALPILRLASDLMRKLISVDRRQTHNLRVKALRAEIRKLRRIIRSRDRLDGFENQDPERLRLSEPEPDRRVHETPASELKVERRTRLRYTERWSAEVDGLDAGSSFLVDDRLIISSQKMTLALSRGDGEVLWSQPSAGSSAALIGGSLIRHLPEGELELLDVEDGEVYARCPIATSGSGVQGAIFAGGGELPPVAIVPEARQRLAAVDLRTGQPRWNVRARGQGEVNLVCKGRVLVVTSGHGTVDALDVASGELVWRFSESVRFSLPAAISGRVVVAVAGEPGGGGGAVYAIDLFSGRLLWQRPLPAAPSREPVADEGTVLVPFGRSRSARLLALEPKSGHTRFSCSDPGLDNGAQVLWTQDAAIINTPAGRVLCLDLESGETRWKRALANPLTDDVPRKLEPILHEGALYVPSAQLHVLNPDDGEELTRVSCDLVPDGLLVDERGWFYVAEESGHLRAYAAAPHLSLVR
ncbi:MAG: PQQ-binding-like beta-propeller repeat protein [Myxococcales bacterium]|nr:PQQ-binding-like beta-propeller repeat protein [Myxococcales bacterium]